MNQNKIIAQDIQEVLSAPLPFEKLANKTFLVSGASGFIGSYLIEVLLAIPDVKVIALLRNPAKIKRFDAYKDNKNLSFIVQDVSQPLTLKTPLNFVVHAASQASPKFYGTDPVGTLRANTLGTDNLLQSAVENHAEKFIFFSSNEIYGPLTDSLGQVSETYTGNVDITQVRSCYAESKRMGETMCVCYSHQFGLPVNMLRLSHTYGPGIALNDGRVFADFVNNILHNQDIVLRSDGSAKRNFCYITDMLRAFFYILFYGENKQAYNIATEQETSILELAHILTGLYPDKQLKVQFCQQNREGYIPSASSRACMNIEKIKKLGWKPHVSVAEGFKRMIESYLV